MSDFYTHPLENIIMKHMFQNLLNRILHFVYLNKLM